MVVVVRSYWPQSLYCQMDKTGDCGRTHMRRKNLDFAFSVFYIPEVSCMSSSEYSFFFSKVRSIILSLVLCVSPYMI